MAKYSQDFKHKVVQAYLNGLGGYNTLSHHFSVTHSLIMSSDQTLIINIVILNSKSR